MKEKIYTEELKYIPHDWELVVDFWNKNGAHILIGKSESKYTIIRTFALGDNVATSVDYHGLDINQLITLIVIKSSYHNERGNEK